MRHADCSIEWHKMSMQKLSCGCRLLLIVATPSILLDGISMRSAATGVHSNSIHPLEWPRATEELHC